MADRLHLESPFVSDELFASEPKGASDARAERAASQSPFLSALEPGDTWSAERTSEDDLAAVDRELDEAELEAMATENFAPQPKPSSIPATKATPAFRIVVPSKELLGKPLVNARWAVHQAGATYRGATDGNGWTGPLYNAAGKFDPGKPFRIHVDGHVCSIVSGAALLTNEPGVEYGGQFVDWGLADDPDRSKRDAFWREYKQARTPRAPLDVFSFMQHDHVMRRPVKLLANHTRAEFEARPLAIRLGPILRYVDASRALVWMELETPGIVRVTYGKASSQREIPKRDDKPGTRTERYTTTVRVGGRHYALVWLDTLDADTAYQYRIDLAPLPATPTLPFEPTDFSVATIPSSQPAANAAAAAHATQIGFQWFFFRSAAVRSDALRFAHGSCRKWPGDHDLKNSPRWPDMLEQFSTHLLAKNSWAEWPQFFLHSGDQIYADDVGVAMGRAILAHRFASVLPGPGPVGGDLLELGAWSGRFGHRYSVRGTGTTKPSPDDVDPDYLRSNFDYHGRDWSLVHSVFDNAIKARRLAEVARGMADATRPLRYKLRVRNDLLWKVPYSERDIPRVDKALGLRTRQAYAIKHRNRSYQLDYPSAGDTEGLHAADFAEYAALYQQAWSQPGTKRLLARLPSFMIFDDHEVTDDWNADRDWLKIVHAKADPFQYWPTTMTDALCAYWVYQGWGNLAPEQWVKDPRVKILERCRKEGRDALPALRRLVFSRAVQPTEPGKATSNKLDWNFKLPTASIPFLAVDLRTDREVNGKGGMSEKRLKWLEGALMKTKSPVAFVVLPVPYLLPDPLLLVFRHPGAIGWLSGSRSTAAFKSDSDIEHPASNPVWDQIKDLLAKLQRSSALKTLVIVSGDIHFSCNLDGQLANSRKAPRLLQLVSSGLQNTISDEKRDKLNSAYSGWWNLVSRAQGVDEHRGMRITLGGLRGPLGRMSNFVFGTSVAVVDVKIVPHGPKATGVPLIVQTHLVRGGPGALDSYTLRHKTQSDGSAEMSLNDPGFAHSASPKDYPATTGGIGIAKELDGGDDETFDIEEAYSSGDDPLRFEGALFDAEETIPEIEASFEKADEFIDERGAGDGADTTINESSNDTVGELDESPQVGLGETADIADEATDTLNTDESGDDGDEGESEQRVAFEDVASGDDDDGSILGEQALFAEEGSSLHPGQSIRVDGMDVRTYVDLIAWYTARRDALLIQQRAFVKERYRTPDGLDDLNIAADARIKSGRKLSTQPISDSHVESMLGWFDRYLEVMYACDRKMEVIAADRLRATRVQIEDMKEQVARLQPRIRDLQRSAFGADKTGKLKQSAETLATALDSVLVAEQWVRDAATKVDDIRVLGTTLRTQKALHGSPQPWHELMREATNAKVAKLLTVAEGLNKVFAVWQLVDSGITLLTGGKTASDRTSAGISFAATVASAGGTLLGASGFFSLYNNLYIGPMVKRIFGQIDQLKDKVSELNHYYIQAGYVDQARWSVEPGGREMYEFMHAAMKARGATDIPAIPAGVAKYFSKHRSAFDAGTPKRHGVDIDYADMTDKRSWVFAFREDIWGMLYGSMPVP